MHAFLLTDNGGKLTEQQAVKLLTEVGCYDEGEDILQWSVVYNLSELDGTIFAHRNDENSFKFSLDK